MVKIITTTCPDCGTLVAGNVLETRRELRCPGLQCDQILRFEDLSPEDQQHLIEHSERYRMEE